MYEGPGDPWETTQSNALHKGPGTVHTGLQHSDWEMGQGEVTLGLCRTRMAAFTYCPLCMALWQTKAGALKWTPMKAGALAFSLPILAGPNRCIGLTKKKKKTSEGLVTETA